MLKLLFVGSSAYTMYVIALYNAAQRINYIDADLFDLQMYFGKKTLFLRVEENIAIGYDVIRLNRDLLKKCKEKKYGIVFLYSARIVTPRTVKHLKNMGIYVALYNNDNPFSKHFKPYFWRHYLKSIKFSDITYVYRISNINDVKAYGAKNVKLLRSYYIKERNFYIENFQENIECPDVIFLGHFENDERLDYIKELLKRKIYIGVPKYEWGKFENENKYLVQLEDTHKNYNKLLNKCKIAIVFLSKINHDTYTRRCFEIPIVKTLMIVPYTSDMANLFAEDEVVFYYSKEDFANKIQYYLKNDEERKKIAEKGYKRVLTDGHEAKNRVCEILNDYYELKVSKFHQGEDSR